MKQLHVQRVWSSAAALVPRTGFLQLPGFPQPLTAGFFPGKTRGIGAVHSAVIRQQNSTSWRLYCSLKFYTGRFLNPRF